MIGVYFLVIVFIALAFGSVIAVNNLIVRKKRIESTLAGIDLLLKKRCELVSDLIAAVSEFMPKERDILEELTALRIQTMEDGLSIMEKLDIGEQLSTMSRGILARAKHYPTLKNSRDLEKLRRSLNEAETGLTAALKEHNATVTEYNNSIAKFPVSIIAGVLDYRQRTLVGISEN